MKESKARSAARRSPPRRHRRKTNAITVINDIVEKDKTRERSRRRENAANNNTWEVCEREGKGKNKRSATRVKNFLQFSLIVLFCVALPIVGAILLS